MNTIAIIPSRYNSSRFPGKPLAMIQDKTMIQRVYEQVSKVLDFVYVATDDKRIFDEVIKFGGRVVMTSENHKSGTDRCAEALENICKNSKIKFDVVINVQGDEPYINPKQIEQISNCFSDNNVQIATLIKLTTDEKEINSKNTVKAVIDENMNAISFSRVAKLGDDKIYKHIGMYAYRTDVLKEITKLPQSKLEIAESLEQLRWLENAYNIKTAITEIETISIDTPEDLERSLG